MVVDKLTTYIKDEFNYYDEDYRRRSKAWVRWHKQWRGILDKKNTTRKSSLFINRTRKAIRAALANILDILFSSSKNFDVVGRTEFDQAGADAIYKVTKWLLELGDFQENVRQFVLQSAIYGTAFAKIVWNDSVSVFIDKAPILNYLRKAIGFQTKYIKKVVSYPSLVWVDIFDIWIDPDATTIEEARGLFHRTKRTKEYLKQKQLEKVYFNVDSIPEKGAAYRLDDTRKGSIGLSNYPRLQDNELYIYEYWGRIPADIAKEADIKVFDDEFEVECIVSLVNMETVIRVQRNTFPNQARMFLSQKWEDSGDRELQGVGVCENVRGEQVALNATINHRIDNKSWSTGSPIVANVHKLQDESDLVARANWIIRTTDDPDRVAKSFAIPDVSANAYVEAREFERFIEEESGVNKYVEADESFGSNRTFKGISLAFTAASRPIRLIARGFENSIIKKGIKLLFTSFLDGLDREIIVRVMDDPNAPEYLKIDPISIALDVDFVPLGISSIINREGTVKDMTEFIQAIGQVGQLPYSDGKPIISHMNWEFIIKKLYEGIGLKDFNKVWLTTPITPPAPPVAEQTGAPGPPASPGGDIASLLRGQGNPPAGRGIERRVGGRQGASAKGPGGSNSLGILALLGSLGRRSKGNQQKRTGGI